MNGSGGIITCRFWWTPKNFKPRLRTLRQLRMWYKLKLFFNK